MIGKSIDYSHQEIREKMNSFSESTHTLFSEAFQTRKRGKPASSRAFQHHDSNDDVVDRKDIILIKYTCCLKKDSKNLPSSLGIVQKCPFLVTFSMVPGSE